MYDELIKRLKYKAGWDESGDLKEAADAIEQLSNAGSAYGRGWTLGYDAGREESKPRWIPVTERKPKTDDIVIVAIHDDSGDTPYDVTNVGFYLDVFPIGIWVVENERCNYVTHWMPLPDPPDELTGTDMRGGIRRDDAGNVIDWGITGPPGDVGKTKEE